MFCMKEQDIALAATTKEELISHVIDMINSFEVGAGKSIMIYGKVSECKSESVKDLL